eukprot:ctg_2151.g565
MHRRHRVAKVPTGCAVDARRETTRRVSSRPADSGFSSEVLVRLTGVVCRVEVVPRRWRCPTDKRPTSDCLSGARFVGRCSFALLHRDRGASTPAASVRVQWRRHAALGSGLAGVATGTVREHPTAPGQRGGATTADTTDRAPSGAPRDAGAHQPIACGGSAAVDGAGAVGGVSLRAGAHRGGAGVGSDRGAGAGGSGRRGVAEGGATAGRGVEEAGAEDDGGDCGRGDGAVQVAAPSGTELARGGGAAGGGRRWRPSAPGHPGAIWKPRFAEYVVADDETPEE